MSLSEQLLRSKSDPELPPLNRFHHGDRLMEDAARKMSAINCTRAQMKVTGRQKLGWLSKYPFLTRPASVVLLVCTAEHRLSMLI